jgi:hypothetical protein
MKFVEAWIDYDKGQIKWVLWSRWKDERGEFFKHGESFRGAWMADQRKEAYENGAPFGQTSNDAH